MTKKIILASNSPRRRELLAGLDLQYEVRVLQGIDESYPSDLPTSEIAQYIATKKAAAYSVAADEILLTADTIVILDNDVLGKPADEAEAHQMLTRLAGKTHSVITGCCLVDGATGSTSHFSVETRVTFAPLTAEQISYYVSHYRPLDKAGAYGIQEWIGYVGVTRLEGSYYNVMGLPVQRIYTELQKYI